MAVVEDAKLERIAREGGARPLAEWTRNDYKMLLHQHKQVQNLNTGEVFALLLVPLERIGGVMFYKRGTVVDARRRRAEGKKPLYDLAAVSVSVGGDDVTAYAAFCDLFKKERAKLDAIWENL